MVKIRQIKRVSFNNREVRTAISFHVTLDHSGEKVRNLWIKPLVNDFGPVGVCKLPGGGEPGAVVPFTDQEIAAVFSSPEDIESYINLIPKEKSGDVRYAEAADHKLYYERVNPSNFASTTKSGKVTGYSVTPEDGPLYCYLTEATQMKRNGLGHYQLENEEQVANHLRIASNYAHGLAEEGSKKGHLQKHNLIHGGGTNKPVKIKFVTIAGDDESDHIAPLISGVLDNDKKRFYFTLSVQYEIPDEMMV